MGLLILLKMTGTLLWLFVRKMHADHICQEGLSSQAFIKLIVNRAYNSLIFPRGGESYESSDVFNSRITIQTFYSERFYSSWNVDRYDEGNHFMVNEIREMLSSAKSTSIFTAGLLSALSMLIFTVNPEEEQNVSPMARTKTPISQGT